MQPGPDYTKKREEKDIYVEKKRPEFSPLQSLKEQNLLLEDAKLIEALLQRAELERNPPHLLLKKALKLGKIEYVKEVIKKHPIDAKKTYCNNKTTMHIACESKHINKKTLSFLIKNGGRNSTTTQDKQYKTPLECLIYNPNASFELARYLHFVGEKDQLRHRINLRWEQITDPDKKIYFKKYYKLRLCFNPGKYVGGLICPGHEIKDPEFYGNSVRYLLSHLIAQILYGTNILSIEKSAFYQLYEYTKQSHYKKKIEKIIANTFNIDPSIVSVTKEFKQLICDICQQVKPEGLLVGADKVANKFEEEKQKEYEKAGVFFEKHMQTDIGLPANYILHKIILGIEQKNPMIYKYDIENLIRRLITNILFTTKQNKSIYQSIFYALYIQTKEKEYKNHRGNIEYAIASTLNIYFKFIDFRQDFKTLVCNILHKLYPAGPFIGAKIALEALQGLSQKDKINHAGAYILTSKDSYKIFLKNKKIIALAKILL